MKISSSIGSLCCVLAAASVVFPACGSSDDASENDASEETVDRELAVGDRSPTKPPGCADLAAEMAARLEDARACNLASAQPGAQCNYVVPTIVGCGAPVASEYASATLKYLELYDAYVELGCPVSDQPCAVVPAPGVCMTTTNDPLGRCEFAKK